MSSAPFINLDAQYLFDLAATFERDDAFTANRLRLIADRLQRLDERVLNFDKVGAFAEGVKAERERILARSNLAEEDDLDPALLSKLTTKPVRRIPTGATAAKQRLSEARRKAAPVLNIKLDLSSILGKKKETSE